MSHAFSWCRPAMRLRLWRLAFEHTERDVVTTKYRRRYLGVSGFLSYPRPQQTRCRLRMRPQHSRSGPTIRAQPRCNTQRAFDRTSSPPPPAGENKGGGGNRLGITPPHTQLTEGEDGRAGESASVNLQDHPPPTPPSRFPLSPRRPRNWHDRPAAYAQPSADHPRGRAPRSRGGRDR